MAQTVHGTGPVRRRHCPTIRRGRFPANSDTSCGGALSPGSVADDSLVTVVGAAVRGTADTSPLPTASLGSIRSNLATLIDDQGAPALSMNVIGGQPPAWALPVTSNP